MLSAGSWPPDSDLLLPIERHWSVECPCVVYPDDPYAEEDPRAVVDGIEYTHALQQQQVESIIDNAWQQLEREPSKAEAVQAFLYYYDHDAYIDFRDRI